MAIACEIMGESLKCATDGPTKTERGDRSYVRQRARVIITIIAACTIMDLGSGGGAEASCRLPTARKHESFPTAESANNGGFWALGDAMHFPSLAALSWMGILRRCRVFSV